MRHHSSSDPHPSKETTPLSQTLAVTTLETLAAPCTTLDNVRRRATSQRMFRALLAVHLTTETPDDSDDVV